MSDYRATTSSYLELKSGSVALESNSNRKQWSIKNLGVSNIYVRFGEVAGDTLGNFDLLLLPGNDNDDWYGQEYWDDIYTGKVAVTGSNLRYLCIERT